eukprot:709574-Prorocentrum_minimum.AAC.2
MGIFAFPFCDWCPLWVYHLSPSAIGARYGYIISPLLRLVPAVGILSLPFCDWCPLLEGASSVRKAPESGGPALPGGSKETLLPKLDHCIYVLRDALCFTSGIQVRGPMASSSDPPMYTTP